MSVSPAAVAASAASVASVASAQSPEENNDIYFHVKIRRTHLVEDAIRRLRDVMTTSPHQMRKPLRVTFIGEDGIDEGGLSKEFCTLLFKQLLLGENSNGNRKTNANTNANTNATTNSSSSSGETKSTAAAPTAAALTTTAAAAVEFEINDVAVYSGERGQEIVQILRLHPGKPAPTEFYTTKILDSYDTSRLGMEPQLSSGSTRLSRLNNQIMDEIARQRMDMKNGLYKRSPYPLFQQDEESKLSWFTPSPIRTSSTSSGSSNPPEETHFVKYPIDVMEYEVVGIVMGLALYNGILLEPCFPLALYRLWLSPHSLNTSSNKTFASSSSAMSSKPNLQDMAMLYPTVTRSLQMLQEYKGNIEQDFGCTYSITRDVPFIDEHASTGTKLWTESLGKSNTDDSVTNRNVSEYVSDYVQFVMVGDCWSRGDAIRRGFLRVVGCPALSLCSSYELELMLCGSANVGNFEDLAKVTKYIGYTSTEDVVVWFWEIVLSYSEIMKRKLLLFVTGSDRVPINGLRELRFHIQKSGGGSERLPTSHTCFNILDLPAYRTKGVLAKKLGVALEYHRGFGLV